MTSNQSEMKSEYFTHDNGGRPFKVVILKDSIEVFKLEKIFHLLCIHLLNIRNSDHVHNSNPCFILYLYIDIIFDFKNYIENEMISLFLFLISSTMCVFVARSLPNHPTKIVDLVHQITPEIKFSYISDVMVFVESAFAAFTVPKESASEFFLIMGILQLMRIVTFSVTILPPLKTFEDKFRLGGLNGTGTEYIFSGHSCYCVLSLIYLWKYNIIHPFFLILYNLLTHFLIIASRNHYTVDVILSMFIVPLVYGNVYFCKQIESCEQVLNYLL